MRLPRIRAAVLLERAQIAAGELDGAFGVAALGAGLGWRFGWWLTLVIVGVFLLLGAGLRRGR